MNSDAKSAGAPFAPVICNVRQKRQCRKGNSMGAWDTDPFGNDTACDWIYELEETDDLSLIENTLQRIHDAGPEYLEAPDAEEAIPALTRALWDKDKCVRGTAQKALQEIKR